MVENEVLRNQLNLNDMNLTTERINLIIAETEKQINNNVE